jgi:hypothetical protein
MFQQHFFQKMKTDDSRKTVGSYYWETFCEGHRGADTNVGHGIVMEEQNDNHFSYRKHSYKKANFHFS